MEILKSAVVSVKDVIEALNKRSQEVAYALVVFGGLTALGLFSPQTGEHSLAAKVSEIINDVTSTAGIVFIVNLIRAGLSLIGR